MTDRVCEVCGKPATHDFGWDATPMCREHWLEAERRRTAAEDATPNSVRCPCSDPFCVLINAIKDYTGWADTRAIDAAYRIKDAV